MKWTSEEIDEYAPVDYAPLQDLYREKGLPASDPEERATYLVQQVLCLTHSDRDVLIRQTSGKSKASTLNLLEEMVRASHQDKINRETADIILPL
tara:strand:+ start:246 stop:530 length:285 start_codon:yes stop_codon:yes gene_type:complete